MVDIIKIDPASAILFMKLLNMLQTITNTIVKGEEVQVHITELSDLALLRTRLIGDSAYTNIVEDVYNELEQLSNFVELGDLENTNAFIVEKLSLFDAYLANIEGGVLETLTDLVGLRRALYSGSKHEYIALLHVTGNGGCAQQSNLMAGIAFNTLASDADAYGIWDWSDVQAGTYYLSIHHWQSQPDIGKTFSYKLSMGYYAITADPNESNLINAADWDIASSGRNAGQLVAYGTKIIITSDTDRVRIKMAKDDAAGGATATIEIADVRLIRCKVD